MGSKIIPNTFQTPNAHVDQAMRLLTGDQYKVLNFAVRHIYGWQDRPERYEGRISLSVFVDGFVTEGEQRFYGCGLSKTTIIKVLDELVKFKLLVAVGEPTQSGQKWTVGISPDWDAIAAAYAKREMSNRKRAENMNEGRARKRGGSSHDTSGSSHESGSSHDTTSGSSHDTTSGSSHDTTSGSSHGTHIKPSKNHAESHDKNHVLAADAAGSLSSPLEASFTFPSTEDAETSLDQGAAATGLYPCTGSDINALITAWFRWTPEDLRPTFRGRMVDASKHYGNKTIRGYAEVLWQRGYRPNDFIDFLRELIARQKFAPDAYISGLSSWSFDWVAKRVEKHAVERRRTLFYTYDAPRCFPMHPKAQSGNAEADALMLWAEGKDHTIAGYSIDMPVRLFTAAEFELLKAGKPLPEEEDSYEHDA